MRLECVYARFYKSFNFDSVRKSHPSAKPNAWELIDGAFFPYVQIPIDRRITTIVGANESGKSHLLQAVKKAVSGDGFQQRDLCRYSPFFNVERGKTSWPHLGLKWSNVSPEEAEAIRADVPAPSSFTAFSMFREGPNILRLFFPTRGSSALVEHVLENSAARNFGRDFLPVPFEIKPGVGLPNSVPLSWLRDEVLADSALSSRRGRSRLIEAGAYLLDNLPPDAQQLTTAAAGLFPKLHSYRLARQEAGDVQPSTDALALARDLLVKLALIDPNKLSDLAEAIADGDDGHANALVARINEQLAKHLNFPKYWAQDRDFSIQVTPREVDLVFTIRDRTGTEYTFAERSHGLKYFLSYLIQAQTREPAVNRPEILLMDEPDAFLSAEAQQDLLKIFDTFAEPNPGIRPVQVVYVTHSPFLLDKNHSERIRVLQKGKGADGTRVIRNASQNHYEPLRSAFGAFVGETAFIGSCNLLVEGAADQILIAGISKIIRRASTGARNDSLDLNRIVIVPCGSASQMPYMVYLIRGRDTEKPPVIALLDSDVAGLDAARALRGGEKRIGRLIKPEYVVDIATATGADEVGRAPIEIEDLLPSGLAVRAANAYFAEVAEFRDGDAFSVEISDLPVPLPGDVSIFSILDGLAKKRGLHIDKVGFARAIVGICESAPEDQKDSEIDQYLNRMTGLFRLLNDRRRSAEREAAKVRIGTMVDRQQANFLRDHPEAATREQALNFLEDVSDVLDDSAESDAVRAAILTMRREFALDDAPTQQVANYESFRSALTGLRHSFEHQSPSPRQTKDAAATRLARPPKKPAIKAVAAPPADRKRKSRAAGNKRGTS